MRAHNTLNQSVHLFITTGGRFHTVDQGVTSGLVGNRSNSIVFNSSGKTSVLLVMCMKAPESVKNSVSSRLAVNVNAIVRSSLGLKKEVSFSS